MTDPGSTEGREGRRTAGPEAVLSELLQLARAVAAHFDGTDAPLGEQARAAIALAEGR